MSNMVNDIRDRLEEVCTHILFAVSGKRCGVDPLARDHINMWCDRQTMIAHSVDEAMRTPFFDGRSIEELAETVEFEGI